MHWIIIGMEFAFGFVLALAILWVIAKIVVNWLS